MSRKSIEKLKQVITGGLCTRCGACVGLSQGRIRFDDPDGQHLPVFREEIPDSLAERIWTGCSGKDVPFDDLTRFCFGPEAKQDAFWGHVRWAGIGFASDPAIRRAGSSGGIITRLLLYLLETHAIQGAVVLGMDPEFPWRPKPYIARDADGILKAAQSKYVISSTNEILPEIEAFDGNLAYVGLPCQVHSIRKLQRVQDPSVRNIRYILGPYCGNTLHFSSIIGLLRSHGVRDYTTIQRLSFREGEWPGKTRIELAGGRIIEMPKFHANYLIPFHIMGRCLLCTDLTNEFADISVGDAWAPVYEERGKGFSVVLARSRRGEDLVKRAQKEGALSLEEEKLEGVRSMHSHGFDLKKRGAFIRLGWRKRLGRPVPEYGYRMKPFSRVRYGMEAVIDLLFWLFRTRMARALVAQIPPAIMGRLFQSFRTTWKKATQNIKRPAK